MTAAGRNRIAKEVGKMELKWINKSENSIKTVYHTYKEMKNKHSLWGTNETKEFIWNYRKNYNKVTSDLIKSLIALRKKHKESFKILSNVKPILDRSWMWDE